MRLTNFKDTLEDQYRQLMAAFLPEGVLDYFNITQVQKDSKGFYIHLEEKNHLPKELQDQKDLVYHAKGFYPQVGIQDFPIRGQKVMLLVKRRRWENQTTKDIVSRDWNLVQKGTRITAEFAAFLKGILG
ncbi:MAG: ISAon1 family transposase N-terminal region protein [Flavisolibacter sp.]